jgi:glycerol kinase
VWSGLDEVAAGWRLGARYEPRMGRDEAGERLAAWHGAVERARSPLR